VYLYVLHGEQFSPFSVSYLSPSFVVPATKAMEAESMVRKGCDGDNVQQ
jgi:hypothetical protein